MNTPSVYPPFHHFAIWLTWIWRSVNSLLQGKWRSKYFENLHFPVSYERMRPSRKSEIISYKKVWNLQIWENVYVPCSLWKYTNKLHTAAQMTLIKWFFLKSICTLVKSSFPPTLSMLHIMYHLPLGFNKTKNGTKNIKYQTITAFFLHHQ